MTSLCSLSRGSQLNRRLWAVPQWTDGDAAAIAPIVRTIGIAVPAAVTIVRPVTRRFAVAPVAATAPLPVVLILALLDLYQPGRAELRRRWRHTAIRKLHSINEAIAADKISLSISNLLMFSGENGMEGLGFR
jgi:hypothetical protein